MGWLRLVGSLKLQVSFAEYRLFHRALLQKRPIILRSLIPVATPYAMKTCNCAFLFCMSHVTHMSQAWYTFKCTTPGVPFVLVMSHI